MDVKEYRKNIALIQHVFKSFYPDTLKYQLIEAEGIRKVVNDFLNSQQDKADDAKEKEAKGDDELTTDHEENQRSIETNDENTFKVERKLVGAEVVNTQTDEGVYLTESFVRQFGLGDEDIVSGTVKDDGAFFLDRIISTPKEETLFEKKTYEFKYGIVEYNEATDTYSVRKNINGERLSNLVNFIDYIIPKESVINHHVTADDTVDLVWNVDNPEATIKLRWVNYFSENTSLDDRKKDSKKDLGKSDIVKSSVSPKKTIEFDLHQQTVGIVIGDKQREAEYIALIKEHNGKAKVIDAFTKQDVTNYYATQLKDCDLVVFVRNLNKHATQTAVKDFLKDNPQVRYAVADKAGIQTVERAIYRALEKLAAQENDSIVYPLVMQESSGLFC